MNNEPERHRSSRTGLVIAVVDIVLVLVLLVEELTGHHDWMHWAIIAWLLVASTIHIRDIRRHRA